MRCLDKVIFFLFICITESLGQKKATDPVPFGYHFMSKKQKVAHIPFEIHSNLLVIKVTIDQSDTLRFILDTGVSSTIITDPEVAQKIGYKYVRTVSITGAGEGEPLMAQVSIGHTLRLGDVQAFQQNLVVLNEDILHLSDFMGIPIHGIFGYDLFNTFVVTIDYENKELFLRSNESFSPRPRRYGTSYPMTVTQSKPYIESMSISVGDSALLPVRLVIDTGAGHALLLNQESESGKLPLPSKVIRANLGRGLNGNISGHVGRVQTVEIGSLKLHNVLASFPDEASFGTKFLAQEQSRQGSVGGEFLRRFRVTFDYRGGRLFLKPNKQRVREPFEHDMSGLEIRGKNKDLSQVYIQKVVESSPAEEAGLQPGDELVFINNQRVTDLTLSEIYKLLSSKEGREIELFIRRNEEVIFTYFRLKRFI